MADPLARSPVPPAPPVRIAAGWEVSARRSSAPLRLADLTPLAKVVVRAAPGGAVDAHLGVARGRVARDERGVLVARLGPDEWLLLAPPGSAAEVVARVEATPDRALVSAVDVTHVHALLRLDGAASAALLAQLCPIDLTDRATPPGTALRTVVARITTVVLRDDADGGPSYLLACERASGRSLADALLEVGSGLDIDVDGPALDRPGWRHG